MKVLLSIKPQFAELIFEGTKKFEFRKAIFKKVGITKIIVYASYPVQKVIGEFTIDEIYWQDKKTLWELTNEHSGIDKKYYESYFVNRDFGYAIKIKSYKRYKKPKSLSKHFNINFPPQSFAYVG